MRRSELGVRSGELGTFKTDQLLKRQKPSLTARAKLVMDEPRPPALEFKQKIELVLENKLKEGGGCESAREQLVSDLQDIFMKKNEGRSEDIEVRNEALMRKTTLLEKRGGWQKGWDSLKE